MIPAKNILVDDFDYRLPESRIAPYPLENRDQSKLLIYKDHHIKEDFFYNIAKHIPGNTLMVLNNTRVIHARLHFFKPTGAKIEIFCLEPHFPSEYSQAFESTTSCQWKCMIGNAKKWQTGTLSKTIVIDGQPLLLEAFLTERTENYFIVEFRWDKPFSFSNILEADGEIPIPPYLNRDSEESDNVRYQTVYSKIEGSVAAPTAGLHFTDNVMKGLSEKKVKINSVTLHVGAGTFRPMKSQSASEHQMHAEHFYVKKELLKQILEFYPSICAVGTTSARTLESLYVLGYKLRDINFDESPDIQQWETYQIPQSFTYHEAIENIIAYMEKHELIEIGASTALMIVPSYKFKAIDKLVTNFHQPKSTLLMLVAAFTGIDWKEIYQFALHNQFRFLSYGDSSLLFRNDDPKKG